MTAAEKRRVNRVQEMGLEAVRKTVRLRPRHFDAVITSAVLEFRQKMPGGRLAATKTRRSKATAQTSDLA